MSQGDEFPSIGTAPQVHRYSPENDMNSAIRANLHHILDSLFSRIDTLEHQIAFMHERVSKLEKDDVDGSRSTRRPT